MQENKRRVYIYINRFGFKLNDSDCSLAIINKHYHFDSSLLIFKTDVSRYYYKWYCLQNFI